MRFLSPLICWVNTWSSRKQRIPVSGLWQRHLAYCARVGVSAMSPPPVSLTWGSHPRCQKSEGFILVYPPPFFFVFLVSHLWQLEVPRLGVESEMQLPACTTATATRDPSLCRSVTYTAAQGNARSLTHWTRARIEPESSWILVGFWTHWVTTGTPIMLFKNV